MKKYHTDNKNKNFRIAGTGSENVDFFVIELAANLSCHLVNVYYSLFS